MGDLPDALARLASRLEQLEQRVTALEHSAQPSPVVVPNAVAGIGSTEAKDLFTAGGIFPVLGRSMLGIAGAYLLRAAAESGSFPKMAVVALALSYAAMWLVWSARTRERAASTAYAVTSALILAPMLWELTLGFKILSTTTTATVIAAFGAAAFALAWKPNLSPVVWVANITSSVTALALLVSSRDLVPFLSSLLALSAATEFVGACGRWLRLRPVVALAADVAVALFIYTYAQPESTRAEYPHLGAPMLIAPPILLFAIYGSSIAFRAVRSRQGIRIFEVAQAAITFLAATLAVSSFTTNIREFGIGCLVLSALCYVAAFSRFDHHKKKHSYYVFGTWGLALLLTGTFLSLPAGGLTMCLSVASLAAAFLGLRTKRRTLEFHGVVYLASAAFTSGLLGYAASALVGNFPALPGGMVWTVSACAVLVYAIGGSDRGEQWYQRLLQLLAAVLAVSAVATFLVSALVWLAEAGMSPAIQRVAVIRTLITCALALGLAFAGSRWDRAELAWVAYGTLGLVSVKLVLQDMRQGHPGSAAASISLYALALILIPRFARMGRKSDEPPPAEVPCDVRH